MMMHTFNHGTQEAGVGSYEFKVNLHHTESPRMTRATYWVTASKKEFWNNKILKEMLNILNAPRPKNE